MRSTKNETRERTEVRVFIATALPTKAVCWTVVAANIFVYICVCFYCAAQESTNHVSSSRKKIIQREKKKKVSGANEKKGKKKVECIDTLNPGVNPKP